MSPSVTRQSHSSEFTQRVFDLCSSSLGNYHVDNYDNFFRGPTPSEDPLAPDSKESITESIKQIAHFAYCYDLLADEASRSLLVELMAYRIMGFRKIKLSRNSPEYWEGIEISKQLAVSGVPHMRIPFLTWPLRQFDTRKLGFDMDVFTYAEAIAINFVQRQYVLEREAVSCKVEAGDTVIDCGACWGDTSLQFACESQPDGHVYAFEFVPSNLSVFEKNLQINPHLKDLITVLEHPVSAQSGQPLFFFENGPASRLTPERVDERYKLCESESIDSLVDAKDIPKVDFIKMDVEGSELAALEGSVQTLKKFRPKLAICVYHKPEDYIAIPKFIEELNLGYDMYLDHHTIFLNETVLFAVPRPRV